MIKIFLLSRFSVFRVPFLTCNHFPPPDAYSPGYLRLGDPRSPSGLARFVRQKSFKCFKIVDSSKSPESQIMSTTGLHGDFCLTTTTSLLKIEGDDSRIAIAQFFPYIVFSLLISVSISPPSKSERRKGITSFETPRKKARFKEEWPGAVRGVNQCGNFSLLDINQSGDTALIDAWIVRNCTLRGVKKGLPPKQ